jgi:hypothetical protein
MGKRRCFLWENGSSKGRIQVNAKEKLSVLTLSNRAMH